MAQHPEYLQEGEILMPYGNVAAERAAIEMTYDSVCSMTRQTLVQDGNLSRRTETEIAAGVPCALSYTGGDSSSQQDGHLIDWDAVVFIAPEQDIRPGDHITVKGITFEVIGRPVAYATHQQVRVKEAGLA